MNIKLSSRDKDLFTSFGVSDSFTFSSEVFYNAVDLISEGPIEGLSDINGNTLNYLNLSSSTNSSADSLAYGIYYNDVSVRDKKTNLFNVSSSEFSVSLGNELTNNPNISSCVYEYKSKIYDLNSDSGFTFGYSTSKTGLIDGNKNNKSTLFSESRSDENFKKLINVKNITKCFTHYVKNKYTDLIKVIMSLDELYYIDDKGNNYNNNADFVICVSDLTSGQNQYLLFQCYMIAKQNSVLLTFEIDLGVTNQQNNFNSDYLINVYSVNKRYPALQSGNLTRTVSVNSIIEICNNKFGYPFSAICNNKVSARHFASIPVRSFDCKMLKIKVPNNYDAEAGEYDGDWNGDFSKNLKWTQNPAWILYDLCTNTRYGLGKAVFSENDINKWEFYKISKYCDELVKTNNATKYPYQNFIVSSIYNVNEEGFNTIQISTTDDILTLNNKYPFGGILFLYDLINESGETLDLNLKKIIGNVTTNGSIATIKLYNDFGPRKFIESDPTGIFLSKLKIYVSSNNAFLNNEGKIKTFALNYISGRQASSFTVGSANESVSKIFSSKSVFESSLKIKSGKCVAKNDGYNDFLEPRFSANIILNNQTEALKVLSDLASIFRGFFYFKNGFLNVNSDIKKPVSFVFNNSNVKNGLFTYSSASLTNNFSVSKVSYLDRLDNFKDKIIYVEDSSLIQKYGIIENEILGFGVTSKSQAQRLGKWFLATGKLESEVVGFIAGLEINSLKLGDIVRITDSLKNSSVEYGRIVSLDFENKYIYIDREVSANCLGKIIKITSIAQDEFKELSFYVSQVDNNNLRLKLSNESYVSWNVIQGVQVLDDGKTIAGDNIGSSSWTRKAFTKQNYIDTCQISFKVPFPATFFVCGLSQINNTTIDQSDINYGFYIANGNLFYNENTNSSSLGTTVSDSDVLKMIFDGSNVYYYKNNSLLRTVPRSVGQPLYGVAAFNTIYAKITNIDFSPFSDVSYGSFSNLRSDASFTIYLNEESQKDDLFRITNVNEISSNEYSITAIKYDDQKFNIIEKDEYINEKTNDQKEIVFSTDNYILSAFTDAEISQFATNNTISVKDINYLTAINSEYDYSFIIENETLESSFTMNKYQKMNIDFTNLFASNKINNNINIYGLYCVIIKNGKTIRFKIEKSSARIINIFLGEKNTSLNNFSPSYSIDFYAFDKNLKLTNV
jgi:hypothetical protein